MLQQKGQIVLDLRPGPGNPRNSEGAFLELKDGRLLFVYSKYIGESGSDDAPCCLAALYSADSGETWTDGGTVVMPEEHGVSNVMSVSLMRMQNGDVGLFYLIRHGAEDMRLHLRRSSDEGKTWGEAVCCIPAPGYFVTNNDRVVRLSNGRLIIPAAFHRRKGEGRDGFRPLDMRAVTYFYLSDDDGATWRESRNGCVLPYSRTTAGMQEPGLVELANGALFAWARTDVGCQYGMFSADGGETWSPPEPTPFTSPCSPLSLKRVADTDALLAIWNPIPNYQTRQETGISRGRTPLVGAISLNEGQTWGNFFAVELEPKGGYCYTAIHFTRDRSVLLAYCGGEPEDRLLLARLKIRKIPLAEIMPASPKQS